MAAFLDGTADPLDLRMVPLPAVAVAWATPVHLG
jgi:hypothetical protein